MMHVVLVLVTIRPEMIDEFAASLLHNARESVVCDPGCVRFDVSQQQDDPARWILNEVLQTAGGHARERQSAHFLAYGAGATPGVVDKMVIKATGRLVAP